ncbi:hypothetical protein [Segeticoccus rhizosphaerae]|uniref:hypothetical protein n=1 Tax=Segeticoccus rhizosphaerae TaxID=1104777 RepID=UPI001EE4C99A|nr:MULTISPECIES: hypothetical protein [Intrasporangiaceae]
MVLREVSVERLGFSCGGCGHKWVLDYDVQHVEDGHGHDRDYYFHEGLPCPDPTAPGAVLCPGCGRGHVAVELLARRASPAVTETTTGDLGTRPGSEKTAARADAPLLAAAGESSEASS